MAAAVAFQSSPISSPRQFLGGLLRTSSVDRSPFAQFGTPADWRSKGIGPTRDPSEERFSFSVAEARRRLSAFISGAVKIRSLQEFVAYVKPLFISVEQQTFYDGRKARTTVNLRDDLTGKTVPGQAVHPKLSPKALSQQLGRDPKADASRAPSAAEMRDKDALRMSYRGNPPDYRGYEALKAGLPQALRDVTAGFVVATVALPAPGPGLSRGFTCAPSPETTQRQLFTMLATASRKPAEAREAVAKFMASPAEKREAFLSRHFDFEPGMPEGTSVGRFVSYKGSSGPDSRNLLECLATPEATRRNLYVWLCENLSGLMTGAPPVDAWMRQSAERRDMQLGKQFVFDRLMTARTPVLLRDAYLVPGARLHKDLSAPALASKLGGSMRNFWSTFDNAQRSKIREEREDNVVSFRDAVARRVGPDTELSVAGHPIVSVSGSGFGGQAQTGSAIKSGAAVFIVIDDESLHPRICRMEEGETKELAIISMHALPPRDYPRVVFGIADGFVRVGADRSLMFLDAQKREHSLDGPSHVDPYGKPAGWAIEGQKMAGRAEWEQEIRDIETTSSDAQPAQPEIQTPTKGFGYSQPEYSDALRFGHR